MADEKVIKIPDIGGAQDVDVIEILVHEGDEIEKDTPLVTLESDKASMDIPSSEAGVVKSIKINIGDKVSEGDAILIVESSDRVSSDDSKEIKETSSNEKQSSSQNVSDASATKTASETIVAVPDIGGASKVDVIELLVAEGDSISKDTPLITLESDKASMDIPSPFEGIVRSLLVKVGDKVSEGDSILKMTTSSQPADSVSDSKANAPEASKPPAQEMDKSAKQTLPPQPALEVPSDSQGELFAGPAVRRLARELGVDLNAVKGTARKGRISKEDVQRFVKTALQQKPVGPGLSIGQAPSIDFSKFGAIETKPLNKIKRLTGINVHRSWVTIPHVTQFDEADITELEAFRQSETQQAKQAGYKITLLAFVCKVAANALKAFPQFNTSLDANGEHLIYKHYVNIGFAVDTPNGLVVPVIKDVDHLSIKEIAQEMSRLSTKAREKGLMPADMSGGCFTISSLGGIGGTAFTPIVNSPEVAILGLSRSAMKPIYQGGAFVPRLMLPLSLSYDHRVIDGAEAARFTRYLSECLSDIRKILL